MAINRINGLNTSSIYGDSDVRLVANENNIALKLVEAINFNARYTFPEAIDILANLFNIKPFHFVAALTKGPNPEMSLVQDPCCFFDKIEGWTELRYEFESEGELRNWSVLNIIAMSRDELMIVHPRMID